MTTTNAASTGPEATVDNNTDVTRITASLPTVDMEITRHDAPASGEEAVTITLRARPGFETMAQALLPSMAAMPSLMGANPFAAAMTNMNPMASAFTALMAPDSNGAAKSNSGASVDVMAQAQEAMQTAMDQWHKMLEQAWSPWVKDWENHWVHGMSPFHGGGMASTFADFMAQFTGMPLCPAPVKVKKDL